jgi:4-hydroxy-tetrahydrodipicolinate synthase
MEKFSGIYAVTATPFSDDESIDYGVAKAHTKWLLDSGVHGLLPLGATGEFAALSIDERKKYAEFIMREVNGKVPVIVGAVSQNLDVTLDIAEHAASIGAAGVMIPPPPGLHLLPEEIYGFYQYISGKVRLPVMIYNNPGSIGVDIGPATMARVAKLPNMALLKESTGDIKRLTLAVDMLADDLAIFCGCENLAHESFVMGATGWVCVVANVAPAMAVELYSLIVEKKDYAAARQVSRQILPLLRLLEDTGELWQVVKYSMQKQGFGNGMVRKPRLPLSVDVRSALDAVLKAVAYK